MAIVVGVLVAVAGWLVNEFFARRATRRNMRIEYLLSAYRRLERASNRHMSETHEAALEEAISDIQLLGSARQVEMATAFARQFAADQRADTEPLLEDLRRTLRRELQLEEVPAQRMWLRIDRRDAQAIGPTVGQRSWAVWEERTAAVAASVRVATGVPGDDGTDRRHSASAGASPFVREMLELAQRTPIGAVVACEQRIAQGLTALLSEDGAGDVSGLSVTELAYLGRERGVINDATRDGIEGIAVMHTMALLDEGGRRLTEGEAREYIGLTEGLMFAMRMPPRRAGPTPATDEQDVGELD
jgi:hypothetical protein